MEAFRQDSYRNKPKDKTSMNPQETITHETAKEILAPLFAINDHGRGSIDGQRFEFLMDDSSMSCRIFVKDDMILDFSCRFDPREASLPEFDELRNNEKLKVINKLYKAIAQAAVIGLYSTGK